MNLTWLELEFAFVVVVFLAGLVFAFAAGVGLVDAVISWSRRDR